MDQETTTNLVAIESLFSTAVCQINLSIDQRYTTVSKWLKECLSSKQVLASPIIESYDVVIGVTNTPPEALEDHIVHADELDEYNGESVDDLIVRYRKLTVADLKAELRKVGLKPRGLKKDLVRQLAEKEHCRLYNEWKEQQSAKMELEAIEVKERERIDAIRDENLCMKMSSGDGENVASGVIATPMKSPLKMPMKSPVTMKVIMTPKKPLASPKVAMPVVTPPKIRVSKIQTPITSSPVPLGVSPSKSVHTDHTTVSSAHSTPSNPSGMIPSTPAKTNASIVVTPSNDVVPVQVTPTKTNTPAVTPSNDVVHAQVTPSNDIASTPSVHDSTPTKKVTPVPTSVTPSTPPKNAPTVSLSTPTAPNAPTAPTTSNASTVPSFTSPVHVTTNLSPHETQAPQETERSMARMSYEDKIQSKTQELLQRVEDMKKRTEASKRRKEEKLQQSFLSTPSKLDTSFHQTRPLPTPHLGVASRVLTDLAALTAVKETTMDVDLNIPVLNVSELSTERSFVSIISSPTAKKRKFIKTSASSTHPPIPSATSVSHSLPLGGSVVASNGTVATQIPIKSSVVPLPTQIPPSQVPIQSQPTPLQPPSVPSQPPSTPQFQSAPFQSHSTPQPTPQPTPQLPFSSQSQPSLPEGESKRPLPLGPRRVPVTSTQLPVSLKREVEPVSDPSISKTSVPEPPRLPSNLPSAPRPELSRFDVNNTPKPRNFEVLQKLVLSEHEDPSLHWYDGDNLSVLVRRQYYESFCSGITPEIVFAEPDDVDLKLMLPNSDRVKRERGSSGDWSRF